MRAKLGDVTRKWLSHWKRRRMAEVILIRFGSHGLRYQTRPSPCRPEHPAADDLFLHAGWIKRLELLLFGRIVKNRRGRTERCAFVGIRPYEDWYTVLLAFRTIR